jgi:hypothetical protein
MATILLGDARSNLTSEEIIEACNVGQAPNPRVTTTTVPPALTREQTLGAQAVIETARLLGKAVPDLASLPQLHQPVPLSGRPGARD